MLCDLVAMDFYLQTDEKHHPFNSTVSKNILIFFLRWWLYPPTRPPFKHTHTVMMWYLFFLPLLRCCFFAINFDMRLQIAENQPLKFWRFFFFDRPAVIVSRRFFSVFRNWGRFGVNAGRIACKFANRCCGGVSVPSWICAIIITTNPTRNVRISLTRRFFFVCVCVCDIVLYAVCYQVDEHMFIRLLFFFFACLFSVGNNRFSYYSKIRFATIVAELVVVVVVQSRCTSRGGFFPVFLARLRCFF